MVYKLISIIILVSSTLFSQQGNTVFTKLITNNTSGNVTQLVPSKYMVGQPFHVVTALFSSRTGQTCTTAINQVSFSIPIITIQSSMDNVVFSDITNYTRVVDPNVGIAGSVYRMLASAAGAFPYIQVNVSNWNSTNCQVNVFYSGSISALDIKQYTDFGSGTQPLQTQAISINTAATTLLVNGGAQGRVVVYALVLYNQTSQNIAFQDTRTDAAVVGLMNLTGFSTGGLIQLPNTNYPLMTTSPGGQLEIVTQNATNLTGIISFRIE